MAGYSPREYSSVKGNKSFQDARICLPFLVARCTEMKCAGGVSSAVIVLTARVAKVHGVGVNHRAGTMSGMMVRDGGAISASLLASSVRRLRGMGLLKHNFTLIRCKKLSQRSCQQKEAAFCVAPRAYPLPPPR